MIKDLLLPRPIASREAERCEQKKRDGRKKWKNGARRTQRSEDNSGDEVKPPLHLCRCYPRGVLLHQGDHIGDALRAV